MVEIFIFCHFLKFYTPGAPRGRMKTHRINHPKQITEILGPWVNHLPNAQIPTLSNKKSEGIVPRHEESPEKCATQTTEGICLKQSSVVAT